MEKSGQPHAPAALLTRKEPPTVVCHFNEHAIRKRRRRQQQQQQQQLRNHVLLVMHFTPADRSLWQGAFCYDNCLQAKKNYDHAY